MLLGGSLWQPLYLAQSSPDHFASGCPKQIKRLRVQCISEGKTDLDQVFPQFGQCLELAGFTISLDFLMTHASASSVARGRTGYDAPAQLLEGQADLGLFMQSRFIKVGPFRYFVVTFSDNTGNLKL